jgi:hypothetical protein
VGNDVGFELEVTVVEAEECKVKQEETEVELSYEGSYGWIVGG